MSRLNANMLLLFVGAIWGMGFVAQSTAMDAIEPVFFTGVRFLVAALAVLPFALRENAKARKAGQSAQPKPVRSLLSYMLLGSVLFASLVTQQIGLLTTTVTNSGFLTGLYVVMTPILAVLIFRQSPHWIIWPAAALTLAGIFLLSGGQLSGLTTGDYWTILCAFLWASHVLLLGRILGNESSAPRPFTLACTQFFAAAVLGIVIALFIEVPTLQSVINAAPEILFTGIVSGGLAFTLQAVAQQHTTAPQAAIFMSSESLFAALFGAIILAERIGPIGLVGCALMFVAMLLVEIVPMIRKTATPHIS